MRCSWKAVILAALTTMGLLAAQMREQAAARDADQQRFMDECRKQFAKLRGRAQDDAVDPCYQAKIRAWAAASVEANVTSGPPLPLEEQTPWLLPAPRGPATARGVIYFVRGFAFPAGALDGFHLAPYFLKTMADDGWDIIEAKLPRDVEISGHSYILAGGVAATIARRVKELRAQGYRRVVAAGHSFGAWATLMAERDGILAADALLLDSPANFGTRIDPTNNKHNFIFDLNAIEFAPLAAAIKTPALLIIANGDEFDPGGRGAVAEWTLAQHGINHLVIDQPKGLSGHYSDWLPFFDFAYGRCIDAYIDGLAQGINDNPGEKRSRACVLPKIVNNDFRSILNISQIEQADSKRIANPQSLVGRKFSTYTLDDLDNRHLDFVSGTELAAMDSEQEATDPYSFREGNFCLKDVCAELIKWSDREMLAFDAKTGALRAWWIDDAAAASPATANSFVTPAGRFLAKFPVAPVLTKKTGKTALGTPYDEYRYASETKDGWFGVSVVTYPKTPSAPDYAGNIAGSVASAKGKLVNQKPVQLGGVEGREVLIDVARSGVVRERLFWVGSSLYFVAFAGSPGGETSPSASAFLDSFALIPVWTNYIVLRDASPPPPARPVLTPPKALSANGRAAFEAYLHGGPHKAFALSPQGPYGWKTGEQTTEAARVGALKNCHASNCSVMFVDDAAVRDDQAKP
jgi:hypothetical protein